MRHRAASGFAAGWHETTESSEGTMFAFPLLVADIGGTNARFAVAMEPAGALQPLAQLRTGAYGSLAAAVEAALGRAGNLFPRSAILCAAGPCDGRRITLTNASWIIDGPEAINALSLDQGLLLNDFEAQALALPALPDHGLRSLTPGLAAHGPTRVVLGPGTGLGVAGLTEVGGRFVALPSEGGHIDFAPADKAEEAIWAQLERVDGRHSAESILSGPGLARLHRARLAAAGLAAEDLDAPQIVERALTGDGGACGETVRLFLRLTARFAGDMALTFGATGGVYLSGGILPRLQPLLDEAALITAFTDKPPVRAFAASVPLHLVTTPDAVLYGLAAIGRSPERYVMDWGSRLWRS